VIKIRETWLVLVASALVACAQGSVSEGAGGEGDGGDKTSGPGSSTASGMGGVGGMSSSSTASSMGGMGGDPSSSSSSSSSSSTGTGSMCPPMQHVCGGICVGNTPDTGCFGSTNCTACPTPLNGASKCDTAGQCDFYCNVGYTKSGSQCVCMTACCIDTDCSNGQTCSGGTCSTPCDQTQCQFTCTFQCATMNKIGTGTCTANGCTCVCL